MLSNPALAPARARPASRAPFDITLPVALAVHLLIIGAVVGSMDRFSAAERMQVLLPLGVAGLLFGYLVALTRTTDLLSHILAVWVGSFASITMVALKQYTPVEIVESRGRLLWELTRSVGTSIFRPDSTRLGDPELLALLGMTTWMLGYTSAWVLYRRGWLLAALVLPAVVLTISLRSDSDRPIWPVALFLFAAVILWARRQILDRQRRWAHRGLRSTDVVNLRALALALPISALVLAGGNALPVSAPREAVAPVKDALGSSWETVRDTVADRLGLQGDGIGNYAAFPESFEIGGRLDLSEKIVATLEANDPSYLGLRRYDHYDGAGWSSNVDDTFRLGDDGATTRVTNVIFARSQTVALSGAVTEGREGIAGIVTVVEPKADLVFTIETFSGASESVVTVLGWRQIERQVIDPGAVDLTELPVDLQALVRDLQSAEATVDPESGEVRFVDSVVGRRIDEERVRLAKYPVDTSLSLDDDGQVLVELSGRVPNYDDIETVFVADERMEAGDQYRVLGQRSVADRDDLAAAGTTYPGWISARYLQLPEEVTGRTRQLARTVAADAGATTPFDQATAIQEHLRDSYAYDLNPPIGENGEDVVDYFLFESRLGRCEQYASAMVVMLRSLDVPTRLVSGYRASDQANESLEYVFREQQAHTWVEAYFPAYGWIPFEPTAGQSPFDYSSRGDASPTPPVEPEVDAATPAPSTSLDPTATPEASPTPPVSPGLVAPDEGGTPPWVWAAAIAGVVVMAGLGWLALAGRGARGLMPAAGLYARMIRLGSRNGVRATASTTPQEFGAALSRSMPRSGGSISTIVDAYHWEQFGPPEERTARLDRARDAWRTLRQRSRRPRRPRVSRSR